MARKNSTPVTGPDPRAVEAESHDKWVSGLSIAAVRGIAADLQKRPRGNQRNHEERWNMGRYAAALRRIDREKLHLTHA